MNTVNASMTVIGAGSYGTALAITLARNGHAVVLWGHNPAQIQTLQQARCNQAFLPDVPFPDTLLLEADLARALAASRDVLVVVPSHVFGDVLRQLKPHLRPDARIVWATKGLEAETGRLLQDVAREALGETIPLAVLSGPTFAKELAAGLPTAIALAATDAQFADDLQLWGVNAVGCAGRRSFDVHGHGGAGGSGANLHGQPIAQPPLRHYAGAR